MKSNADRNNKSIIFSLILTIISVITLIPFAFMISTSLKTYESVYSFPPELIPNPVQWSNYAEVFSRINFGLYYFNSTYIAVLVTIGTCFFSLLAGYSLARLSYPFKNAIFLTLLSGMMIPREVTLIPLFVWMTKLGLVDTHFPLIVPHMIGLSAVFGVFLMRQFFLTIPNELDDSAKIDGCTPWQTFYHIMAPMSTSTVSALAILSFLGSWNEFTDALIFINNDNLPTLPISLTKFASQYTTEWHILMAAAVMATLPILIIFFIGQKRFVESIALTGLK